MCCLYLCSLLYSLFSLLFDALEGHLRYVKADGYVYYSSRHDSDMGESDVLLTQVGAGLHGKNDIDSKNAINTDSL